MQLRLLARAAASLVVPLPATFGFTTTRRLYSRVIATQSCKTIAMATPTNHPHDEFGGDDSLFDAVDMDAMMAPYETPDRRQISENELNSNKRPKLEQHHHHHGNIVKRKENHQPAAATTPSSIVSEAALSKTLQDYFGHSSFRPGQVQVIQNVLSGRDAAVFWPTGQGKSLLYQIPALVHSASTNKLVLVVSPLISLMQDQVHKLNGLAASSTTSAGPIATFLGSAQTDASVERQVFASSSSFRVVYLTPEKLGQAGFLDRLASIAPRIVCIAIDEAHCVSEWGHDFRASYQQIGHLLRGNTQAKLLQNVPLLALTATATRRVQQDLLSSLFMRSDCFIDKQSLDRTNLQLVVKSRSGGIPTAMKDLVAEYKQQQNTDSQSATTHKSTIVYAATRKDVEDVALFLQQQIDTATAAAATTTPSGKPPLVAAYHAGLSHEIRQQAHTNFLTGQTPIIVSTVAFGMGIDKPDTRRVIHYGPPKTVEDYYQQIGRAGRDGLAAECIMYCNPADFERYKSDFYLGNLQGPAKVAATTSMDALRKYSLDVELCRRKALLTYFEETSPFGDRCGTCDVCRNVLEHAGDAQRDFAKLGARTVLTAIDALRGQGMTQIIKVISGGVVEEYRYTGKNPAAVQQAIENVKSESPKKYPQEYYKELIIPMTQKGYLAESRMSSNASGFSKSWTVYSVTPQGRAVLAGGGPVMLPVPTSVRELERQEEEKRLQVLAKLEANGISREKLPAAEVLAGDGEVIRSYTKWQNYLEMMRNSGKEERLARVASLLKIIETWRSNVAVEHRMAPASVLAEHLMISIAYTQATMPAGIKVDQESLRSAGVRARKIDSLVGSLSEWVDANQPASASSNKSSQPLVLDATGVEPPQKWYYAVYRPNKKTGLAVWEVSYNRFANGESPQAIAMSQADGKQPIQAKTVVGHILDAFVHGKKVELHRLTGFLTPINKDEWDQLRAAEVSAGLDVTGDPATSGCNGDKFALTDLLRPIVGDALADTPFKERSQAENDTLSLWYDRLKWYLAFRRVGYEPTFAS